MMSVIMPSHNGERTLRRMLASLSRVRRPDCGVEFILIDNASSDETPAILQREGESLNATLLKEPRRGKSYALNSAIAVAKGDLLVFTDDDVIPAVDWLVAFADAAQRYPGSDIFAGQVRHEWDASPPQWLEHLCAVGRSYGGTPIELTEGPISCDHAKGANLMVRHRAMHGTKFDEGELNYGGGKGSAGGEDTGLVRQLNARGHEITFVPAACVKHIVRAEQVSLGAVFARYVRIGRASAKQDPSLRNRYKPVLFGVPWGAPHKLLISLLRIIYNLVRGRHNDAAVQMTNLAMRLGIARQLYLENRKMSGRRTSAS